MVRLAATAVLMSLVQLNAPAALAADDAVEEGRSIGKACSRSPVCAISKDGSMTPTDACGAQRETAIRLVPGECFDAD